MEQINEILSGNLLVIVAVLLVLLIFLLAMLVNLNSKLRKLQWKYDYFTKSTTMDLDEVLTQTLTDLRAAEANITALEKSRDELRLRLKNCVQNLRVLRYNAFDNTGSDLSYSIALTDEENNGVVISSIYGREENRCYANPLQQENRTMYFLKKKRKYYSKNRRKTHRFKWPARLAKSKMNRLACAAKKKRSQAICERFCVYTDNDLALKKLSIK